jgi:nicotinamide-nucleotide amidase
MNAIIISIGDELVLGQTVDTNSAWLSSQLATIGCDVSLHLTVRDDQKAIEQAIQYSAPRCDYLIISGGIGPTQDDLTRQALAAVMGVELELNEAWLGRLREFFAARGRDMPATNMIQAMIPRGAAMIENTAGTAAGISASLKVDGSADRTSCRVYVTPGVPSEMKIMFQRSVLPDLEQASGGGVILSRTLHTFGLGESWVAEQLGELMKRDRNPLIGTTVANGIVSIRIASRFDSIDRARTELEQTESLLRDRLGEVIFGHDEQSLPEVVAALLVAQQKTVTTAESCTGGLLSKMLTDVAGSSAYFKVGFVTYSNQAKYERLGVPTEMMNLYGAVSEPVVIAMARNARRLAKSDFALSISGVAGPGGGTAAKPVGTVCIALAHDEVVDARTFNFPGDREMIRDRSAKTALSMLRFQLLQKPMPF